MVHWPAIQVVKIGLFDQLIKLISSFLSNRKFSVSVEGGMSTKRIMQAGVPQGSVLCTKLFNMYLNDTPKTTGGVYLTLFADDTCLYATEHKEDYVLRKLQRGRNTMAEYSKRWNIMINEEKTQAFYFLHRIRLPESLLTLNGWNISFVNNVKYLGVMFYSKIAWRLHIRTIEVKAFRAFIGTYLLFKSERLSANIKPTLKKALIRSIMTHVSLAWEFAANTHLLQLQRLQNKVLHTTGNFARHTPVQELHKAFNIPYIYDYITKLCRQQAKGIQNHENESPQYRARRSRHKIQEA
jgi:hypothetical protein